MPEYYYEYTLKADQLECEIHELMNELAIEEMYLNDITEKLNVAKRKLEELMEVFA